MCDPSAPRMQVTVRVPPLYSLKLRHSAMLTMFVYSTKERGIRGQCFRRHRNIDRSIDLNGTKPAPCGYLKNVFSIHILLRRVTIFLRVGSVGFTSKLLNNFFGQRLIGKIQEKGSGKRNRDTFATVIFLFRSVTAVPRKLYQAILFLSLSRVTAFEPRALLAECVQNISIQTVYRRCEPPLKGRLNTDTSP